MTKRDELELNSRAACKYTAAMGKPIGYTNGH